MCAALTAVLSLAHSYQNGPDTYLLQLRDVDFPVRLREYLKVAANRAPFSRIMMDQSHLDWRVSKILQKSIIGFD